MHVNVNEPHDNSREMMAIIISTILYYFTSLSLSMRGERLRWGRDNILLTSRIEVVKRKEEEEEERERKKIFSIS